MANTPDLHNFRDDLKQKPGRGEVKPPRVISATDLDENFAKVTVIDSDKDPPIYRVKYTKDGIIITDLLPDIPTSGGLYVLTASGGRLSWTATEDCG